MRIWFADDWEEKAPRSQFKWKNQWNGWYMIVNKHIKYTYKPCTCTYTRILKQSTIQSLYNIHCKQITYNQILCVAEEMFELSEVKFNSNAYISHI